jgi:hypothetical protein
VRVRERESTGTQKTNVTAGHPLTRFGEQPLQAATLRITTSIFKITKMRLERDDVSCPRSQLLRRS